jgi:uncharacterized membrane-anchored protein
VTLPANRMARALALLALMQTGVLAVMVFDRMRLLTTGREITLPIVAVDPRDLLRGEYVELGYAVGRVPARLLEGPPPSPQHARLRHLGEGAGRHLGTHQAPP